MYANQEHAEIIRRMTEEFDEVRQISQNVSVLSEVTCKFGKILPRTDKRLVFCNKKLVRTDICPLGPSNQYAISWTPWPRSTTNDLYWTYRMPFTGSPSNELYFPENAMTTETSTSIYNLELENVRCRENNHLSIYVNVFVQGICIFLF